MLWCRKTYILGRPQPVAFDTYTNDRLLCPAGGRFAAVDITARPRPFSVRQPLGTYSMHNGGQLLVLGSAVSQLLAYSGPELRLAPRL